LVAPLPDCVQRREQIGALLRQPVLVPCRALLVEGALEDALLDEPVQAVGEHIPSDAETLLELDELREAEEGIADDRPGPAFADDLQHALVDALAADRHVVTFDNVGVGGTTGRTPNTVETMAHDAIAFLEAIEFQRVDLLGFSIGSFIAQEIALLRPDLLRRVVLASSAPRGAAGRFNGLVQERDALDTGRQPSTGERSSRPRSSKREAGAPGRRVSRSRRSRLAT